MDLVLGQLLLAAAWLAFGLVHTATAGETFRDRLRPKWRPYFRLGYNCMAALQLAVIFWFEHAALLGRIEFGWPAAIQWALWTILGLGCLIGLIALYRYDLGAFSGLSQAGAAIERSREGLDPAEVDTDLEVEALRQDGIHRYVRHPLYTGLFLIFWGRVVDDQTLATAVWASIYLIVGARFEERRLTRLYGDEYVQYRRRVPAFFPLPGRRALERDH